MNTARQIQLFILLAYCLVIAALHIWASGRVPPLNLAITAGLNLLFLGFWVRSLSVPLQRSERWIFLDPRVTLMANVPMVAMVFLLLPHLENALRLTMGIFTLGATTALVFGSIRKPPAQARGALSPLGLPVAMVIFYLTHPAPYALPVAIFYTASIIAFLSARSLIQNIFDNAHAANLAARAALAEAEAERRLRTRFLESASHDLGQPLQAARLFLDQAMRSEGQARAHAATQLAWALDTTQAQLAQMLEHLRLEAGAVLPRPAPVALGPLLAHLADAHRPAAEAAGARILVRATSASLTSDALLIERALGNLIGNAIRHAGAGTIRLTARAGAGHVRIWVLDDGRGIAAADAAHLFDDYFQGSDHGDQVRGGFGLGLASVRRMAELLGGQAGHQPRRTTSSRPGGSAFWLELPRICPKAAAIGGGMGQDGVMPHL